MSTGLLHGRGIRAPHRWGGAKPAGKAGGERFGAHSGRDLSDVQAGGRLTLEQRLESVWEGLRAGGTATCPVCPGEVRRQTPQGGPGRCGGCGSVVS